MAIKLLLSEFDNCHILPTLTSQIFFNISLQTWGREISSTLGPNHGDSEKQWEKERVLCVVWGMYVFRVGILGRQCEREGTDTNCSFCVSSYAAALCDRTHPISGCIITQALSQWHLVSTGEWYQRIKDYTYAVLRTKTNLVTDKTRILFSTKHLCDKSFSLTVLLESRYTLWCGCCHFQKFPEKERMVRDHPANIKPASLLR